MLYLRELWNIFKFVKNSYNMDSERPQVMYGCYYYGQEAIIRNDDANIRKWKRNRFTIFNFADSNYVFEEFNRNAQPIDSFGFRRMQAIALSRRRPEASVLAITMVFQGRALEISRDMEVWTCSHPPIHPHWVVVMNSLAPATVMVRVSKEKKIFFESLQFSYKLWLSFKFNFFYFSNIRLM